MHRKKLKKSVYKSVSLSTASDYGRDKRGWIPGRGKRFSLKPLRPTQPPVQWVPGGGGPFCGGKARPGRDGNYSPPSNA
jgi:hypothetical protein